MTKPFALIVCCFLAWNCSGQGLNSTPAYTRADSLRGSLNANRSWFNVLRYDVWVKPNYEKRTIEGAVEITYQPLAPHRVMQVDLQQPLVVDSVVSDSVKYEFTREHNIILIQTPATSLKSSAHLTVYYHGEPRRAVRPPWDGGWIWQKDELGRPWMSVACQGLGASVWYACKDHQSDEPEQGASLTITVPDSLVAVGNGRLIYKTLNDDSTTSWRWEVKNPINNYNIIPYIGMYKNLSHTYAGEDGRLSVNFWMMDYDYDAASKQFLQVMPMLHCFEKWFGPYPFYEDGFQMVQAPHLGMEHQSAIAYGNKFMNGYLGRDLSGTGWGNRWDFIIIHESGHEWFGNNITTNDIADMWVHESFTNYSETIYTECQSGPEAANEYVQGTRKNILNDKPIVGDYGVNNEGSGDMYSKGGNMIHTIRTIMRNDSLFRQMLRNMNSTFYHKTVSGSQVEQFIQQYCSFKCKPIFDQYLRNTKIPVLEWYIENGRLYATFLNCISSFEMPVALPTAKGKTVWKTVRANQPTSVATTLSAASMASAFNKNLYISYRKK